MIQYKCSQEGLQTINSPLDFKRGTFYAKYWKNGRYGY